MTEDRSAPASPHRVVIVGGGAGGLPLATALGDKLGRRGKAAITLVDRAETPVWKTLLHEVAAGRMDAAAHDVGLPSRTGILSLSPRCGPSLNRAPRA